MELGWRVGPQQAGMMSHPWTKTEGKMFLDFERWNYLVGSKTLSTMRLSQQT
jgi:hypothetical protein